LMPSTFTIAQQITLMVKLIFGIGPYKQLGN